MSTPAALRRAADKLERAIADGDKAEIHDLGSILELIGREMRRGKITK